MILAVITLASVLKVLLFLLVLSVLVVLHEYGHFLLARRSGVRVLEFAVGFGPKVAGWRSPKSGTLYSLRWLPLGGYCAMHGEDNKASQAEQQREFRESHAVSGAYDEDNFQAKGAWTRLGIIFAGPFANFLLALIILFVSAIAFGVQSQRSEPRIGYVVPNSPAAHAGLRTGDRIVSLNGKTVTNGTALTDTIHKSRGSVLHLAYERNGNISNILVRAGSCPAPAPKTRGCIGFSPISEYERVPVLVAARESLTDFVGVGATVLGSLGLLIRHPIEYAGQLRGVVGMAQASAAIQEWGWGYYFRFAALISFALGVFNLLPLPALDGGRMAFIIAEIIRGKPVDPEKEAFVHVTGLAVLIALMLAINFYNAVQIYQGRGPF